MKHHYLATRKFAFTLAEVLITLGIIGVVAALVMPGIIQHHKKIVWVNQLKKSMAALEAGFQMAMVEDGVEDLGDTTLLQSLNGENTYTTTVPAEFDRNLRKYFKIVKSSTKSCSYNDYECRFYINKHLEASGHPDTRNARVYYLADGTAIGLAMNSNAYKPNNPNAQGALYAKSLGLDKFYAYVYIDVNGNKGPSTFGRDVFHFLLTTNGKLIPSGSRQYGILIESVAYSNSFSDRWMWNGSIPSNSCLNLNQGNDIRGDACTARIISEGWQMNY